MRDPNVTKVPVNMVVQCIKAFDISIATSSMLTNNGKAKRKTEWCHSLQLPSRPPQSVL